MPLTWEDALYGALGTRVRATRETAKLTQEELAQRVGLTRTSITNIERGHQKIQVHTLYALAAALNVDAGTLLPRTARSTSSDIETRLHMKLPTDENEREWVLRVVRG